MSLELPLRSCPIAFERASHEKRKDGNEISEGDDETKSVKGKKAAKVIPYFQYVENKHKYDLAAGKSRAVAAVTKQAGLERRAAEAFTANAVLTDDADNAEQDDTTTPLPSRPKSAAAREAYGRCDAFNLELQATWFEHMLDSDV